MRAPTPATGFDDPDQTIQVVAPLASDLLRANAGRIFGDMLDRGTIGAEQEGDCIGAFHLCKLLGEGGFDHLGGRANRTRAAKGGAENHQARHGYDASAGPL